jgi:lipopolysaccharide export system permease protein
VRIHDRYILAGFWRNFILGLVAFLIIYVTVDINEKIDDFYDHQATTGEISSYYLFQIPWILVLVLPVSALLSTVFTLGRLARENELTAFVAAGTPLLRVSQPILVSTLLISLGAMLFGEFVVPFTNRRSDRIMAVDIKGQKEQDSFRYRTNLHYQGEGNRTWYAERYDVNVGVLIGVTIHQYDGARLVRRTDAKKAYWDGARWVFMDGAVREFREGNETVAPFARLELPDLPERPEDIAKEEIVPEEMNFLELRRYIDKIRRGGGEVDPYLVDLYFKFSFPFTNLIFAMIGIALSSAKRKPSMAAGFGLTLLISFMYYGILRIGQSLGHSGVIEPLLGAWLGNLVFVVIGSVLLYRANR